MKKYIITIICGMAVAVMWLFFLHRAPAVSFLRYEVGGDGIVRAWFTASNPSWSFVVCTAQAEPNISIPDLSKGVVSIPAHGTATFGLSVQQTDTSWQLTLNYWPLQAQPHPLDMRQHSGKPDFTAKSPVISPVR